MIIDIILFDIAHIKFLLQHGPHVVISSAVSDQVLDTHRALLADPMRTRLRLRQDLFTK